MLPPALNIKQLWITGDYIYKQEIYNHESLLFDKKDFFAAFISTEAFGFWVHSITLWQQELLSELTNLTGRRE